MTATMTAARGVNFWACGRVTRLNRSMAIAEREKVETKMETA
jgi:hypothetical protein